MKRAAVHYRVEIYRRDALIQSIAAPGYRPTVHRNAAKLMDFLAGDAYQLRRVRDGKAIDRRERPAPSAEQVPALALVTGGAA